MKMHCVMKLTQTYRVQASLENTQISNNEIEFGGGQRHILKTRWARMRRASDTEKKVELH